MKWKQEFKILTLKEKTGEYIKAPDEVLIALAEDFSPIAEELYMIILDIKNQIIEKHLIAKGGYNLLMIKPADIFRPLLINGGINFVIAHNHPAGDPEPSAEDINFTKNIEKAAKLIGVNFLDHIIYTGAPGDYYSFKKEQLL